MSKYYKKGSVVMKNVLNDMIFKEGIQSFFKGFIPSLLLCTHGILSMYFYENWKLLLYNTTKQKQYNWLPFFMGAISKGMSNAFLYPLTLIRTRVQKQQIKKL